MDLEADVLDGLDLLPCGHNSQVVSLIEPHLPDLEIVPKSPEDAHQAGDHHQEDDCVEGEWGEGVLKALKVLMKVSNHLYSCYERLGFN